MRDKLTRNFISLRHGEGNEVYLDGKISIQTLRTYIELEVDKDDKCAYFLVLLDGKDHSTVAATLFVEYADGEYRASLDAWREMLNDESKFYVARLMLSNGVNKEWTNLIDVDVNFKKIYSAMKTERDAQIESLRKDIASLKTLIDAISERRAYEAPTDLPLERGMIPMVIDDEGHVVYTFPLATTVGMVNGKQPIQRRIVITGEDIAAFGEESPVSIASALTLLQSTAEKLDKKVTTLAETVNNINNRLTDMEVTLVAFKNNQ